MMKLETLFEHCAEIISIVKRNPAPDEFLSQYFRSKKYIGSKERKIISEVVFIHLRFLGFTEVLFERLSKSLENIETKMENLLKILITLYLNLLLYPEQLQSIINAISKLYNPENNLDHFQSYIIDKISQNFNLGEVKDLIFEYDSEIIRFKKIYLSEKTKDIENISARLSLPKFIMQSWLEYYPKQDVNPLEIAESLLFPSPFTIRVNNLIYSRNEILEELQKEDILGYPTKFSPFGITIIERINLLQNQLYKSGKIEIQDEGSQLVCLACNPETKFKILDACAGAGGKSLFFAFLQKDKGFIVANDVNILKLKELQHRARRAGFKSIITNFFKYEKNQMALLKENYFDIVLVDAPCSGIGTARRNPMHKWLLTPKKLQKIAMKQTELLSFYSRFVKKGGILVYSTCSLMPEENTCVAKNFLLRHREFIPEPLSLSFKSYDITLPLLDEESFELTLFPNIHGTDGFYIAKFRRAT
ncbi:MAG: RsmB/NOP family class I SAM-dependent RNA methyltransferase [Candidatus Kapaibacteriota bacterium]